MKWAPAPLLGSGCADSSAGLPRNRVIVDRTHTVARRRRGTHRGTHRSHSICSRARDLRAPPLVRHRSGLSRNRQARVVILALGNYGSSHCMVGLYGVSKGSRTTPLEVFLPFWGITGSKRRTERTPQVLAGQGILDRSSSHQSLEVFRMQLDYVKSSSAIPKNAPKSSDANSPPPGRKSSVHRVL
ncbi:hypothetical protein AVEN_161284-1 [Araneus ventricosus]|uniref:Uncharacterized protein n=1 Tax=Araneus ventricosus TaxID=182803 RepID=A0A4Y2W7M9_ARAVE|nr:hypothetical protein AVEN_161284-1 [Araneus ventricosus]